MSGSSIATRFATFGYGEGFILLDEVRCNGTEKHILDCPANDLGAHDCSSYEDAGVYCPG